MPETRQAVGKPGPLTGIRVVEFGTDVGVRYCGRLFATLGAGVIQGSAPLDDCRLGYAGVLGEAYGRWLDAGKHRGGAGLLASEMCDLVIAGQDSPALEAGASFARDHASRPVLLSLRWFDPAGPYGRWVGSDEVVAALNGVAYPFGEPAGPPMLAQGHAQQVTAGLTAFNAAVACLLAPAGERPGRIDLNVLEASMCFSETGALIGRATGDASVRLGINRFVPTYPCSPYRTADGWVGVTCLTPAQWGALCRLIEQPELAADPRFATAYQRLLLGDEVDDILRAPMLRRPTDAWVKAGARLRIPIAPMKRPGELPAAPHWVERDAFAPLGPEDLLAPTLPFRLEWDGAARPRWRQGGGQGPLSGLRVVDFSMGWAGPLCTRTLGDLGADVIKIESVSHPDWWRGWEAGSVDPASRELRHNFIGVNRNKRGIDLDLTTAQGLARARALVAGADVVVENFAAGVLDKLGLGHAVQRALRPGIVSVSMPAFGVGGPLSELRAYGSTVEQASGMPFVNGEAHWPPAQQHIAFGDPVAGLFAASAILAALYGRGSLGGAWIDLSQVACLFQLGADAIIAEQVAGGPLPRTGHARARLPLCTVVRARGADDWLAVAPQDDDALARLERIVGGPGQDRLAAWSARQDGQAAAQALQAAGVAAAPVNRATALCEDAQLRGTGFWCEMDHAFAGVHLNGAPPFRFDGKRPSLVRPAPTLGQHTAEVLLEVAGK